MKKRLILAAIFVFFTLLSHAQYVLSGVDGGSPQWIKLGNLALPQGGSNCFIRIIGGNGYNAQSFQQGNIEIYMRTSNGSSVDANGFGFSATATCFGRNKFISDLRIVPQGGSGTGATSYDIYGYRAEWPGNSFYTVESTGAWTNAVSVASGDPGGYVVPFEYFVANDAYFLGKVGIGTNNSGAYGLQIQKTSRLQPAVMIGGAFPGGPRLQVYGLDADGQAYMGLGADMGSGPYEHSVYYPTGPSWAPGKLTFGDFNGSQYNTRMTLLQNGNLGIGVNNPGSPLALSGINPQLSIFNPTAGNETSILFNANTSGKASWFLGHNEGNIGIGNFGLYSTIAGQVFTVLGNNGNLGIGTPMPNAKLQVNSNNSGIGYTDWVAANFGAATGDRVVIGLLDGTATIGAHNNALTAWADIVINPFGGRVGIGTKTPLAALDVGGHIQISSTDAANPPADLSYGLFPYSGIGLGIFSGATGSNQGIGFWTNGANQKKESLRINASGYVGVGTTAPQTNLEVSNGSYSNGNQLIVSGAEHDRYNGIISETVSAGQTTFSLGTTSNYTSFAQTLNLYNGNVAIGTTDSKGYKLAVAGTAIAEQMTVKLQADWPDYIFNKNYTLRPLADLKNYIDKNHHLPEIPSAAEVKKDGLNLGEMNGLLVKKVEELTLYLLEKEKEVNDLKADRKVRDEQDRQQNERLKKLEEQLNMLLKGGK